MGRVDVIGIAAAADRAAVQVFPLRGGRLVDRYSFYLENVAGQDAPTLLEATVAALRSGGTDYP